MCRYCNGNELIYDQMKCLYNIWDGELIMTLCEVALSDGSDLVAKESKVS